MGMDRTLKKKKWTVKKIAWIGATAFFVVLVGWFIIFGDHSSKLNVRAERITISTVQQGPFQEFIPVTGTVIPIKTVYLDAEEGGRVDTLFLEAGTLVKRGDKILKLANTNLLMDVMYREAELFQQTNNLRNTRLAMEQNRLAVQGQILDLDNQIKTAKRTYNNALELQEKSLISTQDFDEARDRYDYLVRRLDLTLRSYEQDSLFRETQIMQLEESVERIKNNLKIVQSNLERLTLRAPVSGHLTSLNAEIGESKRPGENLGQIDILDGFKVRVGIDEHYIARINIGQAGEFTFAGEAYNLIIKKVYPEVVNGRFEVDMEFVEREPEDIRRGQTLHIRVELGDLTEAILLDRGGFYQKTGGQWVFVVDESEEFATKRKISIGRQNPDVFEVLEGLEPGEKVITSSYDTYGDIEKLILLQ
jgi:HlyD family secretion protein